MNLVQSMHFQRRMWHFRKIRAADFLFLLAVILLIGGASSSSSIAQDQTAFGNNGSPIDISSDRLSLDQGRNIAIFEGHVVAKQTGSTLKSERLEVKYGQRTNPATGKSERSAKFLIATGSVILILPDQRVTGDWGRYDLEPEILTMSGNIVVERESMTLTGNQLIANMRTGVTRVLSDVGVNLGAIGSGNN